MLHERSQMHEQVQVHETRPGNQTVVSLSLYDWVNASQAEQPNQTRSNLTYMNFLTRVYWLRWDGHKLNLDIHNIQTSC